MARYTRLHHQLFSTDSEFINFIKSIISTFQFLNQISRRATGEPIVPEPHVTECHYRTERVVDILTLGGETVSVIMKFELFSDFIRRHPVFLCKHLHILAEILHHFRFADSAKRIIFWTQRYIPKIIQSGKYIDMAKLCYTGNHHKPDIIGTLLDNAIKAAKHILDIRMQIPFTMTRIEHRLVIFINQDDRLFSELSNRIANETIKSCLRIFSISQYSKFQFIGF